MYNISVGGICMDSFSLTSENPIIAAEYEKSNYYIEELSSLSNKCIIFCSGNGIYYPNDEITFRKTVIDSNRYEWQNLSKANVIKKFAAKIIYIRDLYKAWYLLGINKDLSSIDAIVDFLQEQTKGYDVITVGNSSGAYMSTLLALKLNATMCFNFCGQFILDAGWTKLYSKEYQYNSLIPLLEENKETVINYFYPYYCENDQIQAAYLDKISNIHIFPIKESVHGITLLNFSIPKLITLSSTKFIELGEKYKSKTAISKLSFCIASIGIVGSITEFSHYVLSKINYLYRTKIRKNI